MDKIFGACADYNNGDYYRYGFLGNLYAYISDDGGNLKLQNNFYREGIYEKKQRIFTY